jgi:HSP20 family protein
MKFEMSRPASAQPWNVIRELAALQERMNEIWGNVYDRGNEDVTNRGTWSPAVDIYETEQRQVVLKADLAGLKREDIDLTFENQLLTIRGERRRDDDIKDEAYHRVERTHGPFSRSFSLPASVDAGRVSAEYRDGVLTVTLPMREETRPRQIQVDVS